LDSPHHHYFSAPISLSLPPPPPRPRSPPFPRPEAVAGLPLLAAAMLQNFDDLYASFAEIARFDTLAQSLQTGPKLKDCFIGIEAAEYLNNLHKFQIPGIQRPIKEALLPAMGGMPFGLKSVIKTTLDIWRAAKIRPVFVFSGMDLVTNEKSFSASEAAVRANTQAWSLYDNGRADEAVEAFSNSASVTAEDLFRYLQAILREEGIQFVVAPYGAWAQVSLTHLPRLRL
jgi:hypothetical protein